MTIGIYKLTFIDGSTYIGKSLNIEERYREHCRNLQNKKHHNINAQETFNIYNKLPTYTILQETFEDILSEMEAYYITKENPSLNILKPYNKTMPKYSNYSRDRLADIIELQYTSISTKNNTINKLIEQLAKTSQEIQDTQEHTNNTQIKQLNDLKIRNEELNWQLNLKEYQLKDLNNSNELYLEKLIKANDKHIEKLLNTKNKQIESVLKHNEKLLNYKDSREENLLNRLQHLNNQLREGRTKSCITHILKGGTVDITSAPKGTLIKL